MKRKILIIIIALFSIYSLFKNSAKAEIVIEKNRYYDNTIPLISTEKTFNVIKGVDREDVYYQSIFYSAYKDYAYKIIESCTLKYNGIIYNESTSIPINAILIIEEGKISDYKVYFNDNLIYHIEFVDDELIVNEAKTIDINKITELKATNYKFKDLVSYEIVEVQYYEQKNPIWLEDYLYDMGLSLIIGYNYQYNTLYSDKDVYFVTTNSNPISLKEIENNIIISDDSDVTASFTIDNNEYELDKIDITYGGIFSFDINAIDTVGNITIQKCKVYVYDNIPPELNGSNLVKKYNEVIYEETLMKLFECDDETAKIYIDKPDELLYGEYNKPNTYIVNATAIDAYDNADTCTIKVIIEDKEHPNIELNGKTPELLSSRLYSKSEIIELLDITDNCYSKDELTIEILNYEDYSNYYFRPARYVLTITASDPQGNTNSYELEFYVKDYDFPQIIIGTTHTLIVAENANLSKEEVLKKLQELGEIPENIVSIESEYFTAEDKYGSYELYLTDANGRLYTHIIEIESPSINYDPPINDNNKKNNKYIVYVVIGIVGVISIGVIMIIIYKKRKH